MAALLIRSVTAVVVVNGWTDAPGALTTVICAKALPPKRAVGLVAAANGVGIVLAGLLLPRVADTMLRLAQFGAVSAQAAALDKIWPRLTEQEQAVFRRGRNAHTSRSGGDYHKATGLEALFGYLYFQGQSDRIRELFDATTQDL